MFDAIVEVAVEVSAHLSNQPGPGEELVSCLAGQKPEFHARSQTCADSRCFETQIPSKVFPSGLFIGLHATVGEVHG